MFATFMWTKVSNKAVYTISTHSELFPFAGFVNVQVSLLY